MLKRMKTAKKLKKEIVISVIMADLLFHQNFGTRFEKEMIRRIYQIDKKYKLYKIK